MSVGVAGAGAAVGAADCLKFFEATAADGELAAAAAADLAATAEGVEEAEAGPVDLVA